MCDIDSKRVKEVAKEWGAKSVFTDYREMFKKVELDAVMIATPNNVHRNQAIAAAKAGGNVRSIQIYEDKFLGGTSFKGRSHTTLLSPITARRIRRLR